MPNHKLVSLKSVLLGEVVSFLAAEEMECVITQVGLVELINALSYYKEEGKALYPEIYVFDDLSLAKKVLPLFEHYIIGEAEKSTETMLKALKKCAPLTEGGWVIYILRKENTFEYGVFRCGISIISVSISQSLIDGGLGEELKVILVHQVAEKIVEVRGIKAEPLIINFGTHEQTNESPLKKQEEFITQLVKKVDSKYQDQVLNFYKRLFIKVLQQGHGTLACVIDKTKKELPKRLSDGILLKDRIDVVASIIDMEDSTSLSANSRMEGYYSLILGMLLSDGITVFGNDGSVLAYNVFIKHSEKIRSLSGGARSRTFYGMCDLIGKGLEGAYIQSQDGKIDFK